MYNRSYYQLVLIFEFFTFVVRHSFFLSATIAFINRHSFSEGGSGGGWFLNYYA